MADDPHRQFDFWLGEWEVHDADGGFAGRNRIEPLFGGRAIAEHWEGASGLRGVSHSVYVERRGQWHQTWVDSSGALLLLDGGLRDDAMVLEGTTPADGGGELRHRISWAVTENPDRVRQHWEVSRDAGATWETAFDGRYARVRRMT
jgi:hypothetical protein